MCSSVWAVSSVRSCLRIILVFVRFTQKSVRISLWFLVQGYTFHAVEKHRLSPALVGPGLGFGLSARNGGNRSAFLRHRGSVQCGILLKVQFDLGN